MQKKRILQLATVATIGGLVSLNPSGGLPKNHPHYLGKRANKDVSRLIRDLASRTTLLSSAVATNESGHSLDQLKANVGFVLGSKTHADYVEYQCGGQDPGEGNECDGPPKKGLVGVVADIANGLPELIMTGDPTIEECLDLPTDGSTLEVTDPDGVQFTLAFSEASATIPADWNGGGGLFDRRISFSMAETETSTAQKFVLEFSCTQPAVYLGVNMLVGDHAPGYYRPINVFAGKDGENRVAQVFVSEVNPDTDGVRGAYAFALEIDDALSAYKIWGATGAWGPGYQGGDQMIIHGNYSTDEASVNFKRFVTNSNQDGSGPIDTDALAAFSGSDSGELDASDTFGLTDDIYDLEVGDSVHHQGCVSFAAVDTAPSSAALCAGMDLESGPTPVLGAAGSFSSLWAIRDLAGNLEWIDVE